MENVFILWNDHENIHFFLSMKQINPLAIFHFSTECLRVRSEILIDFFLNISLSPLSFSLCLSCLTRMLSTFLNFPVIISIHQSNPSEQTHYGRQNISTWNALITVLSSCEISKEKSHKLRHISTTITHTQTSYFFFHFEKSVHVVIYMDGWWTIVADHVDQPISICLTERVLLRCGIWWELKIWQVFMH